MSVKISLLKKSKEIVSNWLSINYDGEYNLFYSTGTKQKEFKDQFLKIQLDCKVKLFSMYASKIREELVSHGNTFSELRFKIFPLESNKN